MTKIASCFLLFACIPLAQAGIRPSFWPSKCAWEATDVLELAVAPGAARFRVVASIKGATQPGSIKVLPELAPPPDDHSLLKDLLSNFPYLHPYEIAPPIRDVDRLIVFLLPGDKPTNWTILTSAIWFQDGVAYSFEQTMNPGPTHLVAYSRQNEALVRANISHLLKLRETFDHAVANPNVVARVAELAQLLKAGDDVVTRGTLAQLAGEGPEAAHALRPFLDDDSLLNEHFQILDSIAATGARDIRLDWVIRSETEYWAQTCQQRFDENWVRNYGQPPSYHYLRLVSALKTIRTLGIDSDLPAVRQFRDVLNQCRQLNQQQELMDITTTLLGR